MLRHVLKYVNKNGKGLHKVLKKEYTAHNTIAFKFNIAKTYFDEQLLAPTRGLI